MPVNKSLAKSLIAKYGQKRGESIYYGLENSGKKSFAKGLKTAKKEGHTTVKFPKKSKPNIAKRRHIEPNINKKPISATKGVR